MQTTENVPLIAWYLFFLFFLARQNYKSRVWKFYSWYHYYCIHDLVTLFAWIPVTLLSSKSIVHIQQIRGIEVYIITTLLDSTHWSDRSNVTSFFLFINLFTLNSIFSFSSIHKLQLILFYPFQLLVFPFHS